MFREHSDRTTDMDTITKRLSGKLGHGQRGYGQRGHGQSGHGQRGHGQHGQRGHGQRGHGHVKNTKKSNQSGK